MLSSDLNRHAGKFYGKYSGLVVDVDDPQKLGRIKVRVPAVYGPELDAWARPCLPYAHFFIPKIETRVWVEFEAGDPEFPLWVGIWYADGEVPAAADVSPPENRVIHTAAGHQIELMDKEGEERITITHKGEHKIEIDQDGVVTIQQKDGHKLVLDQSTATLEHKDGAKVTLENAKATVEATTIELKGNTVKAADGAMEPTILGQTFATMWAAFIMHTHPSAVGPTGTPVPPGQPLSSALTQKTKVA